MFADGAVDQLYTSIMTVDTSSQEEMLLGWPHPTMDHTSGTTGAMRSTLLSHRCPCCRNRIARIFTTTKKVHFG